MQEIAKREVSYTYSDPQSTGFCTIESQSLQILNVYVNI